MDALAKGVKGTQAFPLIAANLSAGWLMKEAERRKMGERIRELRERSPYKQRDMARKLRLSTRMYQKVEERGTTKWDRVQKIARIHKVDPYLIWTGEERAPTPTLGGALSTRLTGLEEMLVELRVDVAELGVDLARGKAQQQKWRKRAHGLDSSVDHP